MDRDEQPERDEAEDSTEEYIKPRLQNLGTFADAMAGAPGPMSDGGTPGADVIS